MRLRKPLFMQLIFLFLALFASFSCFASRVPKGKDLSFKPEIPKLLQDQVWMAAEIIPHQKFLSDAKYKSFRKLSPPREIDKEKTRVFMIKAAFAVNRNAEIAKNPNLFSLPNLKKLFPNMKFKQNADGKLRAFQPLPSILAFLGQGIECDASFSHQTADTKEYSDLEETTLVARGTQSCINFNRFFDKADSFYRFYAYKDKTVVVVYNVTIIGNEAYQRYVELMRFYPFSEADQNLIDTVFGEEDRFKTNLEKFNPAP